MAGAAGLLDQVTSAGQTLAANRVSPMSSSSAGTNGTGASNTSSAGITANDFLTLLVTEMKNQDPTANTDPNEYINQLVNVNSLQQLISINETLSGAFGSSSVSANIRPNSATGSAASTQTQSESPVSTNVAPTATQAFVSGPNSVHDSSAKVLIGKFVQGNLSDPTAGPAARRLSQALDGHTNSLPVAR